LNLLSNRKGGATAALVAGNSGAGAGIKNSGEVTILSSLDRSSNGSVKASQIAAGKADLGTQAVTWGVAAVDLAATAVTVSSATAADGASTVVEIVGETTAATLVTRKGSAVLAGDGYAINGLTGLTADSIRYVARDGDTQADIAQGLASLINFEAAKTGTKITATVEGAKITVTNNTGAGLTAVAGAVSTSGTAAGGLDLLGKIDVTTANGAKAGLTAIEGLIQTAIKASAEFGSAQKRIDIQRDFVSSLSDSLKAGIGSMVDADMEEASARLQALQVQQQLGIQALSIANQAPQNILALFR